MSDYEEYCNDNTILLSDVPEKYHSRIIADKEWLFYVDRNQKCMREIETHKKYPTKLINLSIQDRCYYLPEEEALMMEFVELFNDAHAWVEGEVCQGGDCKFYLGFPEETFEEWGIPSRLMFFSWGDENPIDQKHRIDNLEGLVKILRARSTTGRLTKGAKN